MGQKHTDISSEYNTLFSVFICMTINAKTHTKSLIDLLHDHGLKSSDPFDRVQYSLCRKGIPYKFCDDFW